MPAKKSTVVTSRTIKARLSDTAMLGKLEKLKADKGWNDSDLLREALREYFDRERLRDDLATMDKRFGTTLKRLTQKQNVMRSEMAVLMAFMHEFSGLYLFHTVEPPVDVRQSAAADAQRRHAIFLRRVERAYSGGNPLDELAMADALASP
jgi:hypothetical protein